MPPCAGSNRLGAGGAAGPRPGDGVAGLGVTPLARTAAPTPGTVAVGRDANGPSVESGFGFDVTQGQVLEATVESNAPTNLCESAVPTIAPFGNWTWTLGGQLVGAENNGQNDPLVGFYLAMSAGCTGTVDLEFSFLSGDPFQPSVPGQLPHVVMARHFWLSSPASATCHECDGVFVVNLQRL
jgi:hypothetical protein